MNVNIQAKKKFHNVFARQAIFLVFPAGKCAMNLPGFRELVFLLFPFCLPICLKEHFASMFPCSWKMKARRNYFMQCMLLKKIGINVLYTPALQNCAFTFSSLDLDGFFAEFCAKYSLDIAFQLNSLMTSCAPFITGQLNAEFLASLMCWNQTQLKIIIDALLEKYSLASSRMLSLEVAIAEILAK